MPQLILPIFVEGESMITHTVSFEKRDGWIYYFQGGMPLFSHAKEDIKSFRMFSRQLIVNGACRQVDIIRAFGVPPISVKRSVKLYREGYSPEFFLRMWRQRIACQTYHKYPKEKWPENEFKVFQVTMPHGEIIEMELAERGFWLGLKIWVREIRRKCQSGHQTAILSTDYVEKTGKVIYHTGKMQKGKNKKNFTVYSVEEFIVAITHHIPEKSFQTTRYYGHYSNKSRGLRAKAELVNTENRNYEATADNVEVIDVSKYQPKNVPSLTWRERIKKIWKDDPLICPECSSTMKIISFIDNPKIIKKILKYLNLWDEESSRDPPFQTDAPDEIVYVPIEDTGWEQYQNPVFSD